LRTLAEIRLRAVAQIGRISRELQKAQTIRVEGGTDLRLASGGKSKTEQLKEAGLSVRTANRYEQLAAPDAQIGAISRELEKAKHGGAGGGSKISPLRTSKEEQPNKGHGSSAGGTTEQQQLSAAGIGAISRELEKHKRARTDLHSTSGKQIGKISRELEKSKNQYAHNTGVMSTKEQQLRGSGVSKSKQLEGARGEDGTSFHRCEVGTVQGRHSTGGKPTKTQQLAAGGQIESESYSSHR